MQKLPIFYLILPLAYTGIKYNGCIMSPRHRSPFHNRLCGGDSSLFVAFICFWLPSLERHSLIFQFYLIVHHVYHTTIIIPRDKYVNDWCIHNQNTISSHVQMWSRELKLVQNLCNCHLTSNIYIYFLNHVGELIIMYIVWFHLTRMYASTARTQGYECLHANKGDMQLQWTIA